LEYSGKNVRSGLSITFYSKVLTYIIQFSFGIFLARILSPSDYGLVGILSIFFVVFEMLVDSGFGSSILQKKDPDTIDYSTIFWFNFLISIALYIILFFTAPLIASFYNNNQLISIIRSLGIVCIINSFGSIQGKYLNKSYKYNQLAVIYVSSVTLSSAIALFFAYTGYGVWALVIKTIVFAIMLNFGWWIVSSWKPDFTFSFKRLKSMFGFGSRIFVISIFDSIFNNIYSLIIGKLYNVEKLGYYSRGKQFTDLPDQFIRGSAFTLLFPALSNIQDDDERLKLVYKKVVSMLAFLLFPAYIILGCISHPLVEVLLTDKWISSVVFVQILSFMAVTFPFQSVNSNILYVKGHSNYLLIVTVIRRLIFIALIIVLYRYGVEALAWGMVIDSIIDTFLNAFFANKVFKYNLISQFRDTSAIAIISLLMLGIMLLINNIFPNPVIKLFAVPTIGLSFYLTISWFFRKDLVIEALSFLKIVRK
jgi:teichuronic acid exporter